MKKVLSTIVTTSFLLGSATVFAATGEQGMEAESNTQATQQTQSGHNMSAELDKMFKKLDTNHDGMIDKKEAQADKALSKDFNKVAKNGKLDQHGYGKWEQSRKNAD